MDRESRSILAFIFKTLLFALPLLLIFIGFYIIADPFKSLREREDYFSDGLSVNKGLVSVRAFEGQREEKKYDSFILGASISCYYRTEDWIKYLPPGSVPVHFDSSGQSISTLRKSLEYLHGRAPLRNVLIVLDPVVFTFDDMNRGPLMPAPPLIDIPGYEIVFQYNNLRAFMSRDYLASYVPYIVFGLRHQFGAKPIFEPQPIHYDRSVNEESIPDWDKEIEKDAAGFAKAHGICPPEKGTPFVKASTRISPSQRRDLEKIRDILEEEGTGYVVIMGPNLRLELLGDEDTAIMREIFGNHYKDLGSSCASLVYDSRNFYDHTHYRAQMASRLMRAAYSSANPE